MGGDEKEAGEDEASSQLESAVYKVLDAGRAAMKR
jgi:hypothetical protein